ncbi:hypothetical protein DFJ73DRAFT_36144 [Zopfochytrium polystomum]|nr:hypothetical protein DFJ73DRAFT_36144 [Zopfochytrium polystomum]
MLAGFLDVGRLRAVSTFIALLIAAATADASPAPTATGSSSLPISGRVLINRGGGSPLTKGAASGATLKYYGGPLIRNVQVFPMFYGEALYQKELTDWYKVVVNSSYMDILAEYSTPNYQLGRGSLIGTYKFTTNLKDKLDDVADVQPLLRSLVKTGVLNPNENTYYPIHLRPSTSVIQGGDTSCVTFCGYHGTIDISDISKTKYLYYGIIADQTGDCFGGCGASTNPLYNAESVAAHELMEAITDPGVALAATYSAPLGWYDKTNGEIGDICNAMQSSMVVNNVKYVIQKEWSNQQSACIALPGAPYSSKGPSPTPTASCHDVCIPGDPLSPSCGSVAACVIKADSFCGVVSWDAACIKLAVSNCGASCSKVTSPTFTICSQRSPSAKMCEFPHLDIHFVRNRIDVYVLCPSSNYNDHLRKSSPRLP